MVDVHMYRYMKLEGMLRIVCLFSIDSIVWSARLMNAVFTKRFFPLMSFR